MATPTKEVEGVGSNASQKHKNQENSNPNLSSPCPSIKSAKKSESKNQKQKANPNPFNMVSPRKKMKERKFVVAKKKTKTKEKEEERDGNCKCKEKVNGKCLCVAYDNLRASQEEFFKSRGEQVPTDVNVNDESESPPEEGLGTNTIKRPRDIVLEEARLSVPDAGSGRVLHLVKAFETLLTLPPDPKQESLSQSHIDNLKWPLPALHPHPPHSRDSTTNDFCPGDLFFNAQCLGLDARASSSFDSCRGSVSSRSSVGSRRSRRSGSFSSETVVERNRRKKQQQQQKVTSLRPFTLRTEQRGKMKEEEFMKKLQEMMFEEEKQRIPIAQGLPWTTDEPECLIKPVIKEITKPVDLKLHSDVRAVERADFDHQVAEKLMLIEQYKMERERQQKLEEEEEIKRLRKELVPKAQPMPYFDRPFAPRRSMKQPTVPKEPKFQFPQQKKIKCSLSWDDFNDYIHAS